MTMGPSGPDIELEKHTEKKVMYLKMVDNGKTVKKVMVLMMTIVTHTY